MTHRQYSTIHGRRRLLCVARSKAEARTIFRQQIGDKLTGKVRVAGPEATITADSVVSLRPVAPWREPPDLGRWSIFRERRRAAAG